MPETIRLSFTRFPQILSAHRISLSSSYHFAYALTALLAARPFMFSNSYKLSLNSCDSSTAQFPLNPL